MTPSIIISSGPGADEVSAAGFYQGTLGGRTAAMKDGWVFRYRSDLTPVPNSDLYLFGDADDDVLGVTRVAGGCALSVASGSNPLNLSRTAAPVTGLSEGNAVLLGIDTANWVVTSSHHLFGTPTVAVGLGTGAGDGNVRAAASFANGLMLDFTTINAAAGGNDIALIIVSP